MKYGYFHGDKGIFTGNVFQTHGGIFYEIKLIEGHEKGTFKLVTKLYEEA